MSDVGRADGHYHMAGAKVESLREGFLKPELLQGNFAAAFDFGLVLAAFVVLHLDGPLHSAVLELDFGTHAPAVAEVIAEIEYHVRQVYARVVVVFEILGSLVAVPGIRIKIIGVDRFSITADSELGRKGQSCCQSADCGAKSFTHNDNSGLLRFFGCKITYPRKGGQYSVLSNFNLKPLREPGPAISTKEYRQRVSQTAFPLLFSSLPLVL